MEQLEYGEGILPPRPQGKTIQTLLQEREEEPWFWRFLAALAPMLILLGFLMFPGAFTKQGSSGMDGQVIPITVEALVIINVGNILSVALWFLRKNWLFQLDFIFLPCLFSSFFGFVNTMIIPTTVLQDSTFTAPALASMIVSLLSTAAYSVLSLFTWRRIRRLRQLGSAPARSGLVYVSDEEQQRRQMQRLFDNKDQVTAATLASQRTYNIEPIIPASKQQQSSYSAYPSNEWGAYNTV